jgi:hypothetical protein
MELGIYKRIIIDVRNIDEYNLTYVPNTVCDVMKISQKY